MNRKKILKTIKEKKLSKLRRDLRFSQALLIGFMVSFFVSFFEVIKDVLNGSGGGIGSLFFILFLAIFSGIFGMKFANDNLLVELKEEGVNKWKRKKALEYIEKKEGLE